MGPTTNFHLHNRIGRSINETLITEKVFAILTWFYFAVSILIVYSYIKHTTVTPAVMMVMQRWWWRRRLPSKWDLLFIKDNIIVCVLHNKLCLNSTRDGYLHSEFQRHRYTFHYNYHWCLFGVQLLSNDSLSSTRSALTLNVQGRINSVQHSQCHGSWCPGSLRRQDISTHDIDYV